MNGQILYFKELRTKTNWLIVIFLTPWLLFDIAILFFIGFGLIFYPDRVGDEWPIWILFFIIGVFVLNTIIWNLRGTEIITVTENGITIKKTGNLFSSINNIEFRELESIDYANDDETPLWMKFWGMGGGKIIVKYLGIQKRIGQNLDLKTAEQITIDIKNAIDWTESPST